MTGVDSRKENRAALVRVLFRIIAIVMVIPLLETPGIRAIAWLRPMLRASAHV